MTVDPSLILQQIENLSIKEALAFLVVNKISNLSKAGYEKIKEAIQNKHNESKYYFVPNKEEANRLKELRDTSGYKRVSLLIPNYRHIDLISTGLLIDYYHKNDTTQNRDRVGKIKKQVLNRPNGTKLLKILNFPTTPFFFTVMDYLQEKYLSGYPQIQLEEKFEELIENWESTSKFVRIEDTAKSIERYCKHKTEENCPIFFLLGMRSATKQLEKAINNLINSAYFDKAGYNHKITRDREGNQPRVQVTLLKE